MGEILTGSIVGADAGGITVRIPYSDWERFCRQEPTQVLVQMPDGRHISPEQNRLAWALMTEIGLWAGYSKQEVEPEIYRKFFAPRFALDIMQTIRKHAFHLSTATVQEGRQFINMLIDFCVSNGVPTSKPLTDYTDDIQHYVYACVIERKCAVCGQHADIHHVDPVGRRSRDKISHIGMRCLPLCRIHHNEAHDKGNDWVLKQYHLQPIKIDEAIAKKFKLGRNDNE